MPWMHGSLDLQLAELVHRGAFLAAQMSVRLQKPMGPLDESGSELDVLCLC